LRGSIKLNVSMSPTEFKLSNILKSIFDTGKGVLLIHLNVSLSVPTMQEMPFQRPRKIEFFSGRAYPRTLPELWLTQY
jgi:hypothetical protein